MRWRLPSRRKCSLVVLVAAAGHDGRRPGHEQPLVGGVNSRCWRTMTGILFVDEVIQQWIGTLLSVIQ